MALSGFPDEIKVTLGSNFAAGGLGYGLTVGDDIILKRVGATDAWTETGSGIASASNRIRVAFGSTPIDVLVSLFNTAGTAFTSVAHVSMGISPTYNFLDVWNRVITFTPSTIWQFAGEAGGLSSSWVFTPGATFSGYTPGWTYWKPQTFSLMEENIPVRPDKTTYPFG